MQSPPKNKKGEPFRPALRENVKRRLVQLDVVRLRFIGSVESVLQCDQIFARFKGVEGGLLSFELLVGVVGRFDGQADSSVALVDLDYTGGHFLANLEHVLD